MNYLKFVIKIVTLIAEEMFLYFWRNPYVTDVHVTVTVCVYSETLQRPRLIVSERALYWCVLSTYHCGGNCEYMIQLKHFNQGRQ
jgi:hypothetical protein